MNGAMFALRARPPRTLLRAAAPASLEIDASRLGGVPTERKSTGGRGPAGRAVAGPSHPTASRSEPPDPDRALIRIGVYTGKFPGRKTQSAFPGATAPVIG